MARAQRLLLNRRDLQDSNWVKECLGLDAVVAVATGLAPVVLAPMGLHALYARLVRPAESLTSPNMS